MNKKVDLAPIVRKVVALVREHDDDTWVLAQVTIIVAMYAVRWMNIRRGQTTTLDSWLKHCEIAYHGTADEKARELLAV